MTPDQGICTLSKIEVYAGQQQACIKESPIVNASGMHSEFHQLHTSSRHDDLNQQWTSHFRVHFKVAKQKRLAHVSSSHKHQGPGTHTGCAFRISACLTKHTVLLYKNKK
eukprot:scaffold182325_cov18-Tisochrysis_lutea.AAC.1